MYKTLAAMRADLMSSVPGFSPSTYNTVIQKSYDDIARSFPWQDMEVEVNLATVKFVNIGGVKFNSGTKSITAATTVSAGWSDGESDGFQGRFISKADEAAYFIICASDSVEITLKDNYIGKTTTAAASAGDGYSVFKHLYELHSSIDTVTQVIYKDKPLGEVTEEYIEVRDPDFWEYGEPERFRKAGRNSANVTVIQIYPAMSDDLHLLRIRGRRKIETLTASTYPLLDSSLILAFSEVEMLKRKKMISPDMVPDEVLGVAVANANVQLDYATERDRRGRTDEQYVKDKMFGGRGHPGQRRIVSYDPWSL